MDKVLKRALLSNAAFSTVCGLGFVLLSGPIAALIGLGDPVIYIIVGAGLLLFAGSVIWVATRNLISAFFASLISAADLLWVLGTVGLITLAYSNLRAAGIIAMLSVAAIVMFFALRQLHGIEQLYAVTGKPEPAVCAWQ